MAIKVKLRQKKISGARKSLYLDFYPAIPHPATGQPTRREFLGMYIHEKPKTPTDKTHNIDTMRIAESIRQKRDNVLNKPEIYTEFEKERLRIQAAGEQDFVKYFRTMAYKRRESNHDNWMSALSYLEKFSGGTLKFADLNEKLLADFKDYLLTTKSKKTDGAKLSQNSAMSYFSKVKACLKQAYRDKFIQLDLNALVSSIKPAETRRNILTIDELNALIKTPSSNQLMKRAALFSALTGLRFSDIEKMVWQEVEYIPGRGYFLNFDQEKTDGVEVQPISQQAYNLLGEPGELQERVFGGLKYSAYENLGLRDWVRAAGIAKYITFHCFRHTYATLQLSNGTDIYTVSKMLGHKNLKTTEIYAKIVDETKRATVDRIKLEL